MSGKIYYCTVVLADRDDPTEAVVYRAPYRDKGSPVDILERILRAYKSEINHNSVEPVDATLGDTKEGKIIARYLCAEIAKKHGLSIDKRRDPPGYYQ